MGGFQGHNVNVGHIRQFNPSDNLNSAGQLFGGIADRVEKRAKTKAINELMGVVKTDGQSAMDYQQQQQSGLLGVNGIDPKVALGLASAQSEPYFIQQTADVNNAYKDANLVQAQDNATATSDYRTNVLEGQQTDRTNTADYRTKSLQQKFDLDDVNQFSIMNEDGTINPENLEQYRQYKSTPAKPLDETTREKNKSMTAKNFDDILFKQLGEDGYGEFNKLPVGDKAKVFTHWKNSGTIPFGVTNENYFSSDDYGVQDIPEIEVTKSATAPDDVKYIGNKAYTADGTRASQYDK